MCVPATVQFMTHDLHIFYDSLVVPRGLSARYLQRLHGRGHPRARLLRPPVRKKQRTSRSRVARCAESVSTAVGRDRLLRHAATAEEVRCGGRGRGVVVEEGLGRGGGVRRVVDVEQHGLE